MKALVKKKAGEGLWLEEVPRPEVAPHLVLVKVSIIFVFLHQAQLIEDFILVFQHFFLVHMFHSICR